MLSIRPEKPEDYPAIHHVNQAAFNGEAEARLVDALRKTSGFIPEVSLVATEDGRVVGHILLTIVHIDTGSDSVPVISLAPMAVLPEYQNQGIGSRLVRAGMQKCKEFGYGAIVVVGHPAYYPRFGFSPAKAKGLRLPFEAPDEAFMVSELVPNSLAGISGTISYPPEFAEAE